MAAEEFQITLGLDREQHNNSKVSEEEEVAHINLISAMIDSSSSVEELYKKVKNQLKVSPDARYIYARELRKKAPEFFDYIENLKQKVIQKHYDERNSMKQSQMKENKGQSLEDEQTELKKLEAGFIDMCKKYDKRLPYEYRGTAEERQKRAEEEKRKLEEWKMARAEEEFKRKYGGYHSSMYDMHLDY